MKTAKRWIARFGVVVPATAFVLVAGPIADAQDPTPATDTSAAEPTAKPDKAEPTAAPTAQPAATAAPIEPLTPGPVLTPDPASFARPATPEPIVLPDWMEENAAAESTENATSGDVPDASTVTAPQGTSGRVTPHLQSADPSPGNTIPATDGVTQRPSPRGPVDQPMAPQNGDATTNDASHALVPVNSTVHQTCEGQAVSHGISSDTASIVQTAVQHEDCTWGGSQVLVSYDARGPPDVDVLVQSTGVSVDVEAYVEKEKVRLGVGHRDKDGEPITVTPFVSGDGEVSPRQVPLGAGASQTGSNRFEVSQDARATTGDALSGAQRVNVTVVGDAGHVRLLAQHVAPGASASTGDAVSQNATVGGAGPVTQQASGPAQTSQAGDNAVGVEQDARSRSGDALAGSQELDVHVTGSAQEVSVLAQNASPNAIARTGDAVAANGAAVTAGPQAAAGGGTATAGQVGDNHVDVSQSAMATSGDAIASSQVIGITVGGSVGTLGVLASNNATGARAVSGDALAANVAGVQAGPAVIASNGDALSAQIGSNDVRVSQSAAAESGRALAGAQVIEIEVAGSIGQATVTPQNLASDALATSGNAVAVNDAVGSLGPVAASSGDALTQQRGDNRLDLSQDVLPTSGDAVSGGQVVGMVEHAGPVAAPERPELFRPGAITFIAA